MVSLFLDQYILRKRILNLYIVQFNHFVHNFYEHYLVGIVDHLFQHNIFEDQDSQI